MSETSESVDPIWSTWKLAHDLAFRCAALMAEKIADGMIDDAPGERGDPVTILKSFASILRTGVYSDKERAKAMIPIDDAVSTMLDDPRVLGALADKLATGCLPPGSAAYILECLKDILVPIHASDGDDDG